ncbi:MAG TPA: pyrroline-5-carboxylate reductase [Ramlibacter sp.]|nr:pyrroline-5-carboxylate reductase [Ramlibacter sp.]
MDLNNSNPAAPVIAFIGGGQMATALIAGLVRSGAAPGSIVVVEPDAAQRDRLTSANGLRAFAAADPALADAGLVVWAVKPQVLPDAIRPVLGSLRAPLHVSIVAGISTQLLSRWLESDRVVRVMPNTPALVGAGVTGMLATGGVTPSDRQRVEQLFRATGYTFWVEGDDRIDAVTAVSGSGPGYVFQFLASFQEAAQAIGFSQEQARELVLRTAAGAIEQARTDATPFTTLRDRVTSKGGTTEAALEVMTRNNMPQAISQAVARALERAQELSGCVK